MRDSFHQDYDLYSAAVTCAKLSPTLDPHLALRGKLCNRKQKNKQKNPEKIALLIETQWRHYQRSLCVFGLHMHSLPYCLFHIRHLYFYCLLPLVPFPHLSQINSGELPWKI